MNTGAQVLADIQDEIEPAGEAVACIRYPHQQFALEKTVARVLFVGPTLYAQLGLKAFMTAAWNAQVSGHDIEVPGPTFNFGEFTRSRAKLKFAVEF